jgi:hypothetical protein
MSPSTAHTIKIISGTLVIVALVISFFERWYAPNVLVLENSPNFPSWLGWLGWGLAAVAALTYFLVDIVE